ncbi:unnamed protein product [Rotaria magnacalcarata]|uniref:Uncharacterized protein n=1 Tax=Rotaria magnacalcarata TaxID=392030 RepID=A0A816PMA8_9BILA|nr:unnamed protein product [Rotaria magnacalcarata]CAF2049762.1 unnamed protein product [Rotaria magnacalcarata]CAF4816374.1 unnamed protein product [Rotaria magnacalcarata]CAF4879035.1 unnamed protein product [Rotaria magnacalcarata]CAF4879714.1 unnamed protein product [Rotaria magnacalcarata]
MDQRIFSQFLHRVGFTSMGEAVCDGCERKFNYGDMGFRCMECSGFVLPGSNDRKIREVEVTSTTRVKYGDTQLTSTSTTPFTGYDLCLDCAKNPLLHTHHHFTLATYRR